jgi:hypothetical protein
MRMFLFLAGILIAMGVVVATYFAQVFSLGAWLCALALFAFAWIGRSIVTGEARPRVEYSEEHAQAAK